MLGPVGLGPNDLQSGSSGSLESGRVIFLIEIDQDKSRTTVTVSY